MDIQNYRLTGPPQDGSLTITFKRYRPSTTTPPIREPIALLFAHCISTHKETWEPTISQLFRLQSQSQSSVVWIAEAWSIDCPNHGEAAIVNEEALLSMPDGVSGKCCARAVQTILMSRVIIPSKIIAIGHSAGAAIFILSTISGLFSFHNAIHNPILKNPFHTLILIEPSMMTRAILAKVMAPGLAGRSRLREVIDITKNRRDCWRSKDHTRGWMEKRTPWRKWDKDVLEVFFDYALRPLPSLTHPNLTSGVTTACTPIQEMQSYVHFEDALLSLDRLSELCTDQRNGVGSVHCILGTKIDLISEEIHDGVLDPNAGREPRSVRKIEGGHLVVQENPNGTAQAIWDILAEEMAQQKSKL